MEKGTCIIIGIAIVLMSFAIGKVFERECYSYTFNVTLDRNDSFSDEICNGYQPPTCSSNPVVFEFSHNSESMLPTFSSYDTIYGDEVSVKSRISVCDIIAYDHPAYEAVSENGTNYLSFRTTHRVVALNGTHYITKGDANSEPDNYQPQIQDVRFIVCEK